MNDNMSTEDIKKEIDFWNNYIQDGKNFKHKNFYVDFFDFSAISGLVLEVGCGGSPFITYADKIANNLDLHLLDPLINEISSIPRYSFLNHYKTFNTNLLNFTSDIKYKYIICLNVLDHFGSKHVNFIDKMKELLNHNGKLLLYYDIRQTYSEGHYAINHNDVNNYIKENFSIIKESQSINPEHQNWSTVYGSARYILEKK